MSPDEFADKRVTIILEDRHREFLQQVYERAKAEHGTRQMRVSVIVRAMLDGAQAAGFDLAAADEASLRERVMQQLAK